ncbi:hypothetical protein ABER75_23250 [Niallia taxi]|uniref:hypothetical protein n=1 Tax=Niallia taxi TaxID=2499688 RepID=UPI00254CE090|nr:hypothetical protein [Niallia taxi]MDK8641981.1 hypothetical protein [Niallia taxi]MED4036438.1 hypothetical protein [Niallia taxi]
MLWIMSQDKQSLINVKEVSVEGKKIVGTSNEWNKALGKYDSNERALVILHEIYTKIEENSGFSVTFTMPIK